MLHNRKRARRGFSLVELLAVVLVLAVLAAVAIPLYISQRKSAAGRVCKANIAAIAAAESAYAVRNNAYAPIASLLTAAEGLTETPTCPLGGAYTLDPTTGGTGAITIACPNATTHIGYGGTASTDWSKGLPAVPVDSLP